MKKLLISILFILSSFIIFARSGTGVLDATSIVKVTGGNNNGYIASLLWSNSGKEPGSYILSAKNSLKTNITVTVAGTYHILLTVIDNLGNKATAIYTVVATYQKKYWFFGYKSDLVITIVKDKIKPI